MSLDAGGSFAEVSNYDDSWALSSVSLDCWDLHFENGAVALGEKNHKLNHCNTNQPYHYNVKEQIQRNIPTCIQS